MTLLATMVLRPSPLVEIRNQWNLRMLVVPTTRTLKPGDTVGMCSTGRVLPWDGSGPIYGTVTRVVR